MRLMQKIFLLGSLSLIETTFSYIHSNNNVNIGVTINKNVYYIHSAPKGEIANKDNWEKVGPKQEILSSKTETKTQSKQSMPETGGGRISEVKESTACKCGRTDVQEPLHFDYTSRL